MILNMSQSFKVKFKQQHNFFQLHRLLLVIVCMLFIQINSFHKYTHNLLDDKPCLICLSIDGNQTISSSDDTSLTLIKASFIVQEFLIQNVHNKTFLTLRSRSPPFYS